MTLKPFGGHLPATPEDEEARRRIALLEELEAFGTKRKPKMELLKANVGLMRDIFKLTYDWQATYGVLSVPKLKKLPPFSTHMAGAAKRWIGFVALLHLLDRRDLTGGAATQAILAILRTCSDLEAKWYRRVLSRDMRVGVALKTVNQCLGNIIPVWSVQLAGTIDSLADLERVRYPVFGDWKIDGIRMTFIVSPNGKVVARSRSGHDYPQLARAVAAFARKPPGWYDAEAYAGRWNDTSSLLRLDPSVPENLKRVNDGITIHVFDYVPLDRNAMPDFRHSLVRRRLLLKRAFFRTQPSDPIKVIGLRPLFNADEAKAMYLESLERGYEGVMIKSLTGRWKPGDRSFSWGKLKPFRTVDGVVTGVKEGTGKNAGRLGALIVKYNGTTVYVGGGFTDKDRDALWKARERLPGRVVEFKIQDDASEVAAARFLVFKKFRADRSDLDIDK